MQGTRRVARTLNLIATLPGGGAERVVVSSHTDGMNAVWDNGPIAMLALLQHFAALPLECRPFAVGFRVEHPQAMIDQVRYGQPSERGFLPAADYRLTYNEGDGRFAMPERVRRHAAERPGGRHDVGAVQRVMLGDDDQVE